MKYHLDQEVVTGFISEAKSYLPEIVLGLESFAAAPEHDQSIREAFRYAHIIKGAASMLGFHKISEVAYELEIQLEQLSEHQLALTQELLETLCNNVSELSDLLETALDDSPAPAPPVTDVMSELPLPTLPPVPVATTDFEFSFATFGQDTHDELAAPLSPATEQPLLEANNFSMSFPEAANIPTVGELNLHEVAADLKERFGATPLPPQPEIPLPTEWLSALPTDPFALTPPPTALSRELTPAPVPADAHDKFAQELAEDLLAEARGLATPPPPPLEQVLETISQTAEAIKDEVERDTEPDIPDLLPLPELPELLTPTAGASELEELENIAPPSALEAAFVTARAETEEALPPSTHTQTLTSLGSENTFLQTELPEELLETFLLEAEEHLQVMQSVLRKLERVPSDIEALQEIRRSAHSLKGTASLVGFRNIMHLAHRMEDLLDLVYEEKFALTQQATQLLTRATDMIEDMSGGQINETALHDLYADFATLLDEIDTSPIAVEEAPVAAEPMPLAVEPALLETPPAPVLDTNAEAIESSPNALELVLEDNAEATILDLPEADTTILAEEPMTWELSLLDVADEPALSCAEAPATTPLTTNTEAPLLEAMLDLLAAPAASEEEPAAVTEPPLPIVAAVTPAPVAPVLSEPAPVEESAELPVLPTSLVSSPLEITPPPLATPPVNLALPAAPEVIPARPSAPPPLAIEKPSPTSVTIEPASAASTTAPAVAAPLSSQFLRVPIERLDEVVKLIGEMMITRTTFEQRLSDFARQVEEVKIAGARLRRASTDLETKYEVSTLGGGKGRLAQVAPGTPPSSIGNSLVTHTTHGFDDLEFDRYTEFHLLSRELTEASSDIQTVGREFAHLNSDFLGYLNRQSRIYNELQDRLMRLRMVPLASVAPRLQRAVRQSSGVENKQVELILEGEGTAIDTTALQDLIDPLLHLLRNAIAHGIEAPDVRQAQGKAATGRITLRAFYEGSQVVLQLSDDGRGLDEQKIRDKAIRQGLLSVGEATALASPELWPLIFTPGFSTADHVSEIAGRGVGMDVVQTTLQKLKGSITIDSQPGRGVSFTLRLPLTLAVSRALLVKSCEQSLAIPLEVITQILRLDMGKVERIGKEPVIRLGGKIYPLLLLSQLLNLRQSMDEMIPRPPVLLVQVEGREVAVIVDQLIGGREIVIKSLGTHLRKVHGVMGATLLGSGEAVLILNLAELVRGTTMSALRRPTLAIPTASAPVAAPVTEAPDTLSVETAPLMPVPAPLAATPSNKPKAGDRPLTIMVVDDSPSVRRVNTNLIKNTGWIPAQAKDGLEALEKLQAGETVPDLMMLDIEMPRMDGYQLLTSLRALPAFRQLPVVIVSSRASEKHRQKAFDLGATDYLVKPYQEEHVVALIRRLVQEGHQ